MLIVNADDLGADSVATDRTLACFQAGAITSATAMMFMRDSARGVALAREAGLPLGLHLNLTQPFDGDGVPPEIARRQASIVGFMANSTRRRLGVAPHLVSEIKRAVADQLEQFHQLYGGEPTHLDGHNHVHLNPTVLACLPTGYAVRPGHDSRRGLGQIPQRLRHAALARRHRTVDHFFPLTTLHPALGGRGLEGALALADTDSVELMVHPGAERIFTVLENHDWAARIAARPLGSYADVRP